MQQKLNISLLAPSLIFIGVALMGCGRDTMVYPDPAPAAAATPAPQPPSSTGQTVTTIDQLNNLPSGFLNQSANGGIATVSIDGTSTTSSGGPSTAILLETEPVKNSSGGFNGNGVGNLALLGAINYSGTSLASLATITFDAEVGATGSAFLSVILNVDLNCDGTSFAVLETSGPALLASATAISGSSYLSFNASINQNVWQSSGGPIVGTSGTLVPSTASVNTSDLGALIAASPKACIVNRASGDPGLPNGLPTAGILFALGNSSTTDFNSAFINSLTIASTTIDSSSWSQNSRTHNWSQESRR